MMGFGYELGFFPVRYRHVELDLVHSLLQLGHRIPTIAASNGSGFVPADLIVEGFLDTGTFRSALPRMAKAVEVDLAGC
jgi:hypothetical protein